jgi:hypothetical protein
MHNILLKWNSLQRYGQFFMWITHQCGEGEKRNKEKEKKERVINT